MQWFPVSHQWCGVGSLVNRNGAIQPLYNTPLWSIEQAIRGNPPGSSVIQFVGWHGLGVFAMAVSLTCSHGHPEDGKSVAPQIKKGDCPGVITKAFASFKLDDLV